MENTSGTPASSIDRYGHWYEARSSPSSRADRCAAAVLMDGCELAPNAWRPIVRSDASVREVGVDDVVTRVLARMALHGRGERVDGRVDRGVAGRVDADLVAGLVGEAHELVQLGHPRGVVVARDHEAAA